ncbi:MAG: hypothetical protein R3B84_15245 [Zavarzinella sp.]
MELDDGFDADNPFHSVALIFAGFSCSKCGAYTTGESHELGAQTPYRIMAESVEKSGWLVLTRDEVNYDYEVICPDCRK